MLTYEEDERITTKSDEEIGQGTEDSKPLGEWAPTVILTASSIILLPAFSILAALSPQPG